MSRPRPPQEPSDPVVAVPDRPAPSARANQRGVPGRVPAGVGPDWLAYYRCRCLVLEAAVDVLRERLEATETELDAVVTRYEQILDGAGVDGRVGVGSRG